jgi:GTP-binding protein HflX
VELAQLRYRLPRLRGKGVELSRLGAGIGTRGPGESQLETDRRRILERIAKLQRELRDLDQARQTRNKARRRSDLPLVALVGYTNAGKSTVFNLMTDAGVLVEDRLFATLDSTVRRLELVDGHHGLMSDTVGFVRRLPHELVEAFKSTLDEVKEADLLLHVVDAADESPDRQIESVRQVLREIGAGDLPELLVINKIDVADTTAVERLRRLHPGSVAVSAVTGEGRDQLVAAMMTALEESTAEVELLVPYSDGEVLAAIHAAGHVIMQEHVETGTHVKARLPRTELARFAAFKY